MVWSLCEPTRTWTYTNHRLGAKPRNGPRCFMCWKAELAACLMQVFTGLAREKPTQPSVTQCHLHLCDTGLPPPHTHTGASCSLLTSVQSLKLLGVICVFAVPKISAASGEKKDLKFRSTVAMAEPGQLARKRPLVANFSFVEYASEAISRMHLLVPPVWPWPLVSCLKTWHRVTQNPTEVWSIIY